MPGNAYAGCVQLMVQSVETDLKTIKDDDNELQQVSNPTNIDSAINVYLDV